MPYLKTNSGVKFVEDDELKPQRRADAAGLPPNYRTLTIEQWLRELKTEAGIAPSFNPQSRNSSG